MKTFANFIDLCCEQVPLPEEDVRRTLALHLEAAGITERDVELYINYPELTERELAIAFGLSESAIVRTLARVRKAWPSLLNDPTVGQHGSPSLSKMLSYQPWMDDVTVQRF